MEEKNKKVYCLGTKDGKGVIEALEERGGVNSAVLFGTGSSKDHIYYIDPVTNKIISTNKDSPAYNMVISNYTEIPPLKPKRWRAEFDQPYYTVDISNGLCGARISYESNDAIDDSRYNNGNYYRTMAEASKVADACNEIIQFPGLN